MLNDPLAAALTKILNAERVGKREVVSKPASNTLKKILSIMNEHQFIGSFEEIDARQGGFLKVHLLGSINRCGVIKPRFSTKMKEFEKWEKRYLPARAFGIILISTPQGIMTHSQAKNINIGGKLIAYCY